MSSKWCETKPVTITKYTLSQWLKTLVYTNVLHPSCNMHYNQNIIASTMFCKIANDLDTPVTGPCTKKASLNIHPQGRFQ